MALPPSQSSSEVEVGYIEKWKCYFCGDLFQIAFEKKTGEAWYEAKRLLTLYASEHLQKVHHVEKA